MSKISKNEKQSDTAVSYFEERMKLLGVTSEFNNIKLLQNKQVDGKWVDDVLVDTPIFKEVEKGIEILIYTLDRLPIRIQKEGSRMKRDFAMTRLKDPIVKVNGDTIKYLIPKGAGTHPFFPPELIEKYEQKIKMPTIYLTEGYFKARKAAMHGVDIIGLSSITHMKDKDTGALHPDILKLIKSGLVERFVWLTDGDCLDISQKEITDTKDLYTRPRGFFSSITTFKNLLDDYNDIEKWFMHIDIDSIIEANKKITRDQVKGIDDLLVTFNGREQEIVEDLLKVSSTGTFFQKFNISHGTGKVYKHFHLGGVDDFFLFHVERRPELKNKDFKFIGTKYLYDEKEGKCKVQTPGDADLYFRVGDNYYKFVMLPNQFKKNERVFLERKKTTIVDDHGKDFCKHIPKYEAFCNVPDHNNYQQVIENCFNVYSPVDFLPDEDECTQDDCPSIMSLIRHIFGDKTVVYNDGKEKKEYSSLDLALDYVQILYQKPERKLPILCLVSNENQTGKTTFGNFLRLLLGANTAIVGNADLAGDFNAHWATKSVVVCDETKIDKHAVIEKIKNYSTARKIFMNAKGRGQVELDCFIKFVLITNNEENFIYASEEDTRYWVIKVPKLKIDNPHFMDLFAEEMPAFLSFLNKRKMATEDKSRMWFHHDLLKTAALDKVIKHSQPVMEKELRQFFKELFLDTGLDEIRMTLKVVHKEVFNNRFERNYLLKIMSEKLKLLPHHEWEVEGIDGKEYSTEQEAIAAAEIKYPDIQGYMIRGKIKMKYKVIRYSYPRWQEIMKDGKPETQRFEISDLGRPYVFYRKDFVREEDNVVVDVGAENNHLAQMLPDTVMQNSVNSEELPFG